MATTINGGTPIQAIATINAAVSTKADPSRIFTLTTNFRKLDLLTANGNLASGTIITFTCASGDTTYLNFYGTSGSIAQTANTSSGSVTVTLGQETKVVQARISSEGPLTVDVKPATSPVSTAIDVIRASKSYISGTDYTPGEYAHVYLIGAGGGAGGSAQSGPYPAVFYPGAAGTQARTTSGFALTGTYTLTIGAGGIGRPGGSQSTGGTGGASSAFGLSASGGGGSYGGTPYGGGASSAGSQNWSGPDGFIYSLGNISSSTAINGNSGVGFGGTGFGSNTPSTAGDNGTCVVLRYTP
jgi:hypothetical protein